MITEELCENRIMNDLHIDFAFAFIHGERLPLHQLIQLFDRAWWLRLIQGHAPVAR